VSAELHEKLLQDKKGDETVQAVITRILNEHYGLREGEQ